MPFPSCVFSFVVISDFDDFVQIDSGNRYGNSPLRPGKIQRTVFRLQDQGGGLLFCSNRQNNIQHRRDKVLCGCLLRSVRTARIHKLYEPASILLENAGFQKAEGFFDELNATWFSED